MDNLRGSLFMIVSMLLFAVEDMLVKLAAAAMPLGEVMVFEGIAGLLVFAALAAAAGQPPMPRSLFTRGIAIRSGFEVTGRLFYALAIALTPLSAASAILQATPLVVVAGAALVLGERVGPRRWAAILAGFVGVLVILRPGLSGFDRLSLLAVVGMLGFAGRDLATRAAPPHLSGAQLGVAGFAMLALAGVLALTRETAVWPPAALWPALVALPLFGTLGYQALTLAMRTGDVAAVTPFRYTRLIFGTALGVIVFHERPDAFTLLGGAVIVVSGLFALQAARRPVGLR